MAELGFEQIVPDDVPGLWLVLMTPEGEEYYGHVSRLMVNLDDLDADFQQREAGLSGRVRIDVHSSMANMVLLPALEQFRAGYPNIQLAIGITDKPIGLIEETVDCVVRPGRLADSSLIARTIYEDELITCASPALP
jgi:DNA-binding transcriptional LysR family regulator